VLLQLRDKSELLEKDINPLLKKITSTSIPNQTITELNMIILGDRGLTQARAEA